MPDPDRRRLALYALALVVVVVVGARSLGGDTGPATGAPPARISIDGGGGDRARLVVHVAGAVRRPGVYRMRAGARVVDALRRARGPTRRADLAQLNLAAELEDGRQVLVPTRAAAGATAVTPAPGTTAPAQPISLQTATPEQLDTLPGVGPATAAAIIEYRDANGGFSNVDELDQVPGIGETRLAELRELVRP